MARPSSRQLTFLGGSQFPSLSNEEAGTKPHAFFSDEKVRLNFIPGDTFMAVWQKLVHRVNAYRHSSLIFN